MTADKKGIVEGFSWKAIASAIAAVLALYFGIPEYAHSTRPFLMAKMGLESVCFLEGAITGAATFFVVLKLYSQLSSKKETKTAVQMPQMKQVKKRIKQELQFLRNVIKTDLDNQSFQSRTYGMDAFQSLKEQLILAVDHEIFREVKEAYEKINGLQYSANLIEISVRKYQDTLAAIDRALEALG